MNQDVKDWLDVILRLGAILGLMVGASILGYYHPFDHTSSDEDDNWQLYQYLIMNG